MKTGQNFASDINRFIDKNEHRKSKFYREVAISAFGGIVTTSPVDTGMFALSWNIRVKNENSVNIMVNPVSVNKSQKSASVKSTVLKTASYSITGKHDVYITNTLPYASKLEYGHSEQAKNGIIGLVAKQVKSKIEQGAFSDR